MTPQSFDDTYSLDQNRFKTFETIGDGVKVARQMDIVKSKFAKENTTKNTSLKRPDRLELTQTALPNTINDKDTDSIESAKRLSPTPFAKNPHLSDSGLKTPRRMSHLKRKITKNQAQLGNYIKRGSTKTRLRSKSPERNQASSSPEGLFDRLLPIRKRKRKNTGQSVAASETETGLGGEDSEVFEDALGSVEDEDGWSGSLVDEGDGSSREEEFLKGNDSNGGVLVQSLARKDGKPGEMKSLENLLLILMVLFVAYFFLSMYNYFFISSLEVMITNQSAALLEFYYHDHSSGI